MEQNKIFSAGETENRRGVLKKMGSVGAFTIPAIASLQLSEVKVHASGVTRQTDLDIAWDSWWSQNESFWGFNKSLWTDNKQNWFSLWRLKPQI